MRLSNNIALFAALAALATAAPIERREIKYVTTTVAVVETDLVMKTVWVNPDGSPVTITPPAFTTTPVGTAPTQITSVSSASVSLDPAVSSVSTTPSSAAVTLDPSVTQIPAKANTPAIPTPAAPVPAPVAASPAPAAVSVASIPSTGGSTPGGLAAPGTTYTGEITYYETGMGACGITSGYDDHIVAVSHDIFDHYTPNGNPNNNSLCGKTININYNGQTFPATVVDRCEGCATSNLDLSQGFFSTIFNGDTQKGRFFDVTWEWAN